MLRRCTDCFVSVLKGLGPRDKATRTISHDLACDKDQVPPEMNVYFLVSVFSGTCT